MPSTARSRSTSACAVVGWWPIRAAQRVDAVHRRLDAPAVGPRKPPGVGATRRNDQRRQVVGCGPDGVAQQAPAPPRTSRATRPRPAAGHEPASSSSGRFSRWPPTSTVSAAQRCTPPGGRPGRGTRQPGRSAPPASRPGRAQAVSDEAAAATASAVEVVRHGSAPVAIAPAFRSRRISDQRPGPAPARPSASKVAVTGDASPRRGSTAQVQPDARPGDHCSPGFRRIGADRFAVPAGRPRPCTVQRSGASVGADREPGRPSRAQPGAAPRQESGEQLVDPVRGQRRDDAGDPSIGRHPAAPGGQRVDPVDRRLVRLPPRPELPGGWGRRGTAARVRSSGAPPRADQCGGARRPNQPSRASKSSGVGPASGTTSGRLPFSPCRCAGAQRCTMPGADQVGGGPPRAGRHRLGRRRPLAAAASVRDPARAPGRDRSPSASAVERTDHGHVRILPPPPSPPPRPRRR